MNNFITLKLKITLVLFICVLSTFAQQKDVAYAIIPQPVKLVSVAGSFKWTTATKLVLAANSESLAPAFKELKATFTGLKESKVEIGRAHV